MKKILFVIFVVILVSIIYLFNVDNKTFLLSIGDSLSYGKVDDKTYTDSYDNFIIDKLLSNNNLEKYINNYSSNDLRVNDIMNDINSNKKLSINDKTYTLKNLLIKADIVIISINHEDLFAKLKNNYTEIEFYTWVDELSIDYNNLLELIRQYCKEKIFVIGYYLPTKYSDTTYTKAISYLNNTLEKYSNIYNINYINLPRLFFKGSNLVGNYYPTKFGYKEISDYILSIYNT